MNKTHRPADQYTRSVAVAMGASGPVLAILGMGGILMTCHERVIGVIVIAACAVAWAIGARNPSAATGEVRAVAVDLALLFGTPLLTWSNVGRAQGLFAATGVLTTYYMLTTMSAVSGVLWTQILLLIPIVVAQVSWVYGHQVAAVALLGLGIFSTLIARIAPPPTQPMPRCVVRGVGYLSRVGRKAAGDICTFVTGMDADRRSTVSWAPIWSMGLLAAAISAPSLWRFATMPSEITGSGDYAVHLRGAEETQLFPPYSEAPHPLFHYVVSLTRPLLGTPLASTVLLSAAICVAVVCLASIALWDIDDPVTRSSRTAALVAGVFTLVESPSILGAVVGVGTPVDWVPTIHILLSPTDTLIVPFALALAFAIARCGTGQLNTVPGPALALLTVLSLLAKPSAAPVLLGALPFYYVTLGSDRRLVGRHLLAWFAVPTMVVVSAQTAFIELGMNGLPPGKIAVRPLEMVRYLGLDRASPVLWAGALIVPLGIWAAPKKYFADHLVRLTLFTLPAALVALLLINETGERQADGAFAKFGIVAWLMVAVASWRFAISQFREMGAFANGRRLSWKISFAVFLALSMASGVASLLQTSGLVELAHQ